MRKTDERLSLPEIEARVCDVIVERTGAARESVQLETRILEDLGIDSLEIIELVMELEEIFDVRIPDEPEDPVSKQVFTRSPFRVKDLAETIYLRSQAGHEERSEWTGEPAERPACPRGLFTQLGGVLSQDVSVADRVYAPLGENSQGFRSFRRSTDGMQCVLVPGGLVEVGDSSVVAQADERPVHAVRLDPFLIDVEPVSTTAYARFLNSVGELGQETLRRWFVLAPEDRRSAHVPLEKRGGFWEPVRGAERWPMMLVSWFGANAYSLWANGRDWRKDSQERSFLPSEAQWEYAARGPVTRRFPWGNDEWTRERARVACHRRRRTYDLADLPLADVNEELGLSPFGLRHMAGNVWQWCRDDYDRTFYSTESARRPNPVCSRRTGIKSERGGSWIGPADLARSSYRRGRPPLARGRCLGFRCVGDPGVVPGSGTREAAK